MTSLKRIRLRDNLIIGVIPEEIGAATSLERIDFSDNNITGSIPHTIGVLLKVEFLLLQNNNMSGTIPIELKALTAMTTFDAHNNGIGGAIYLFYLLESMTEYLPNVMLFINDDICLRSGRCAPTRDDRSHVADSPHLERQCD